MVDKEPYLYSQLIVTKIEHLGEKCLSKRY